MLERTFCHIAGIGPETERSLWKQGFDSWQMLLDNLSDASLGSASRQLVSRELQTSIECLSAKNHQYFRKRLRQRNAWRAFEAFRDQTVYLDIETDGTQSSNSVTMIGLYDGADFRCLIKGDDLESFRDIVSHYSMIVTFFGTGFDLPVLERRFPSLLIDQIHFDLCPALKSLGIRGGLKKIEGFFGIERSAETQGLTGLDAIKLWRRYLADDALALKTLISYNREDVVNLEILAEKTYEKLQAKVLGLELSQPRLGL